MSHRDPQDSDVSRPRSEPEIIPPGQDRPGIWVSVDDNDGPRRIYIAKPGPFTIVLALAILALVAGIMLILLLSVAVIWIPLVIVLIAAFVLTVTFRQYWWRFKNWFARR